MKKSKFTEEQIAFALRQAEAGTPVEQVCRKLAISQETSPDCPHRHTSAGCVDRPWTSSSFPMSRRIDSRSGLSPRPVTTSRRTPPSPIRREATTPRRAQL